MSSNETIKQAVIAGLGIAFISAHTVASELDERRLVTLDVEGLPIVRQWFALARKDKVCCRRRRRCWISSAPRAGSSCRAPRAG